MSKAPTGKASAPPPAQEPNAAMEQAKADLAAARAAANGGGIYSQLVAAQSEFASIKRDRKNPYFNSKYATYEAIVEATRPILTSHGLGFMQTADGDALVTVIFNGAGQTVTSRVPFVHGEKATPQQIGSALTYAKRYGIACALGVAIEEDETDDDGNRASAQPAAYRKPNNTPTPKQEIPDV